MRALAVIALLSGACAREPTPPSGEDLGTATDGPSSNLDSGCASATAQAKLVPVQLVVMLDRSGSMGDGVNGDAALKWQPVTQGLKSFFAASGSAGVSASLQFFPAQDTCNPSAYYFPAVALRPLPDDAAFRAAMDATSPAGNTPTRPAILGAIDYAQDHQTAGERVAIVLVTDGEPDTCDSSVENVAFEAAKVAASIPTYVIGVGDALASLNKIAESGGTGQPILVSTGDAAKTTADLLAALEAIRGLVVPCRFPLPAPPPGLSLNTKQVNVVYTPGAGAPSQLDYDRDCSSGNGWRYDNEDNPTEIELCPSQCDAARQDRAAKIDVVFGCATSGDLIF